MNRFLKLFRRETPAPLGQIYADDRSALFPTVVADSPVMELWARNRSIPTTGTFLLVGVATWSGYDMKLFDEVELAIDKPDVVGVFDMQEAQSPDDFASRIPGLRDVVQGPVVGLWGNGLLIESGSGHSAQNIVFKSCGLNPDDIPDRLSTNLKPDYEKFWSSIHTAHWWCRHWQKTGLVDVVHCGFLQESDWLLEKYAQARAQQQERDPIAQAVLQGAGNLVGLFCLVAKIQ